MKCNRSRPGFELVSPRSFATAITTTPRAPPRLHYEERIKVSACKLVAGETNMRTRVCVCAYVYACVQIKLDQKATYDFKIVKTCIKFIFYYKSLFCKKNEWRKFRLKNYVQCLESEIFVI